MEKVSYKIISGITLYRIIVAPVLLTLIFTGELDLFKWLLPVSFFTDLIDGYLARKYGVTSILGARLDSIGDDLTVFVAIIALFVFKIQFLKDEILIVAIMLVLLVLQNIIALIRYGKVSSFHTYLAKVAALLQGIFLIFFFLLSEPNYMLFYTASVITIMDLLEEIILIFILPKWEINVRGIYWVMKRTGKKI